MKKWTSVAWEEGASTPVAPPPYGPDVSKKGSLSIHFHKDDPQHRRCPGERITRLLTVSQVC